MSIDLVSGVPGSGKTYYAVDRLKKVYDLKERPIYTNINLKVKYDDYLHLLNVRELYNFAKAELDLFNDFKKISTEYDKVSKEKESIDYSIHSSVRERVDTDIKEFLEALSSHEYRKNFIANNKNNYDGYLKASGLLDDFGGCLIVWDECQNDLEDTDPVWIRFFSYHRHFSIDMILITQDISLLHRKYKSFFDKFYFGQNSSKRFFSKTLRFKVYCDSKQYSKFFIENISLKMSSDVHNFYDSGSYEVGKSALGKFLIVPFLLIPIIYLVFSRLFPAPAPIEPKKDKEPIDYEKYSLSQHLKDRNITDKSQQVDTQKDESLKFNEDNVIIELRCNKTYCFLTNSKFNIPVAVVNDFAKGYDGEVLFKIETTKNIGTVYISIPQNRYEDLAKFDVKTRKDTFGGEKYDPKTKPELEKSNLNNGDKNVKKDVVPNFGNIVDKHDK